MSMHFKPLGCNLLDPRYASDKVKQVTACSTEEKVVVRAEGAFVMWRGSRDFNQPGLTLFTEALEAAVNGCHPQCRDILSGPGLDLSWRQGARRFLENGSYGRFLFRLVRHFLAVADS